MQSEVENVGNEANQPASSSFLPSMRECRSTSVMISLIFNVSKSRFISLPSSVVACKQRAGQWGVQESSTELESQQSGLGSIGSRQLLDIDLHGGAGIWREEGEEVAGCLARLWVERREGGRDGGQEASDHFGDMCDATVEASVEIGRLLTLSQKSRSGMRGRSEMAATPGRAVDVGKSRTVDCGAMFSQPAGA